MTKRINDDNGFSLIELIVAMGILAVLASMALPMAEVTVKRSKELQLHRSLEAIRNAIDAYKYDYDQAVAEKKIMVNLDDTGYPKELEALTKGIDWGGLYQYPKKYLRSIPRDPFDAAEQGWGMRSYIDESDAIFWGGEDIYDVYSQSSEQSLDGSYYRDW